MKKQYIFMADVIRSRDLEGNVVLDQLKAVTGRVNQEFRQEILSPMTITLGDEFQGVARDLQSAIRVLLGFEEWLVIQNARFKLRYVIFCGTIDTVINPESAHEMLGEGLTEARMRLARLKKASGRFHIHTGDPGLDELLTPAFNVFQYFVDQWHERDYGLVASFLELSDYKSVARKQNKDVSLMWRRKRSLHMEEYFEIKKLIILLSKSKRP